MPDIDIQQVPEQAIFGYIDTPFLPSVEKMLKDILEYDYEKTIPGEFRGWTHQLIKDTCSELELKPFATVAFSVSPNLDIRAMELERHNYENLIGLLINKKQLSDFRGQYWVEMIEDTLLPNSKAAILIKQLDHTMIVTRFSLRRFVKSARCISAAKYTETNSDRFMQSLLFRSISPKEYDYRLKATATWSNDTTLHYYGKDPRYKDVIHYDSTEHTVVAYMAAAHRACVLNGVDYMRYLPRLDVKS